MKDLCESIAIAVFITLVIGFLGWHTHQADLAVESYRQAIERHVFLTK